MVSYLFHAILLLLYQFCAILKIAKLYTKCFYEIGLCYSIFSIDNLIHPVYVWLNLVFVYDGVNIFCN